LQEPVLPGLEIHNLDPSEFLHEQLLSCTFTVNLATRKKAEERKLRRERKWRRREEGAVAFPASVL